MFEKSRFNPKPGLLDFWNEFRKPNPYRWPMLLVSMLPIALIVYALGGETIYGEPEQPDIAYITTFQPDRTDEEIIASNEANMEVRRLREAREAEIEERKRELYKALGAASGIDVDAIEERAAANRAAEAEAEAQLREELYGSSTDEVDAEGPATDDSTADEGSER